MEKMFHIAEHKAIAGSRLLKPANNGDIIQVFNTAIHIIHVI